MAGVYISYPFCAQKCTYCNFASGVFPREMEPAYLTALAAEIRRVDWPWTPETVYLGGGTPSNIDPAALASLLAEIPGKPWREATMEAAPGNLTREKILAWVGAGINRVSLGVQSFAQKELAKTGRKHTAEIVEREIAILRECCIEAINIDLISGLPGQTKESWNASLDWVEKLGVPHVSVYMLEVDEDSRLGNELITLGSRYGANDVPSEDAIADFYEIAVERLASMGIPRYEISNFARPGFESLHNMKYWKREPYFGFGADAHSFDVEARWSNPESVADYTTGFPTPERTPADAVSERFFLGLRLREGIAGELAPYESVVNRFTSEGLLESEGGRVRLTPRGVMLSNEVFAEFIP
ncbi:MAG: radical SAM family heme chaperone HemW [Bryobacteraceae bacterium]